MDEILKSIVDSIAKDGLLSLFQHTFKETVAEQKEQEERQRRIQEK